jgi:hypothetical protein
VTLALLFLQLRLIFVQPAIPTQDDKQRMFKPPPMMVRQCRQADDNALMGQSLAQLRLRVKHGISCDPQRRSELAPLY